MRLVTVAILVICVNLSAGCSTGSAGRDFNGSYVSSIERNVTTKAEVRKNFGEPLSVTTTSEGEVWAYQYADRGSFTKALGAEFGLNARQINSKTLMITFKGERVKDFTHTEQKAD